MLGGGRRPEIPNQRNKEKEAMQIRKKDIKLSLFIDNMIISVEVSQEKKKHVLELTVNWYIENIR